MFRECSLFSLPGNHISPTCHFRLMQTGQNRAIQHISGVALLDAAKAVLRRNRGIQAKKDIREQKKAKLNLSCRDLGDEGAKELAEELKVSELMHLKLLVICCSCCSECLLPKGQFVSCSNVLCILSR